MRKVRQFLNDIEGSISIEYSIIGALVAVTIVVAVTAVGGNLSARFYNAALNALR